MINLHTGLPGNGKTLHTISTVEKRRIAENRTVYYYGIKELTLDWVLMEDPKLWYELPPGSIIVIDEAQKVFEPRPNGAPVPRFAAELETNRHEGYDIYLITQDPTFLPSHDRKLANIHRHFMRKFGSKWYTCHQFEGCRDNVAKSRKDSIETQHYDDVSMYGKYKTATVITQKFRVPPKLILAACLPFLLIGLAYYFYQRRISPADPAPAAKTATQAGAGFPGAAPGQPPQPKRTYDLAAFQPRIEGLPHTAPRYDELTAPVRVPTVAGCIWFEKSKRGHCYTQQGTQLFPSEDFIRQYIAKGMFEDHERGPDLGQQVAGGKPANDSQPLTRPRTTPLESSLQGGSPKGGG